MKGFCIFLLLSCKLCLGQEVSIDSCGLDTDRKLNYHESEYFNSVFSNQRGDFNFQDKNILFCINSSCNGILTKKDYFNRWGREIYNKQRKAADQMILSSLEERKELDGIDVIIVSYSKRLVSAEIKMKIINRLKRVKVE